MIEQGEILIKSTVNKKYWNKVKYLLWIENVRKAV